MFAPFAEMEKNDPNHKDKEHTELITPNLPADGVEEMDTQDSKWIVYYKKICYFLTMRLFSLQNIKEIISLKAVNQNIFNIPT